MEEKTLYARVAREIKHPGINLPRTGQKLYEKDYEIITKDSKVDMKNGNTDPWKGKLSIINTSITLT